MSKQPSVHSGTENSLDLICLRNWDKDKQNENIGDIKRLLLFNCVSVLMISVDYRILPNSVMLP